MRGSTLCSPEEALLVTGESQQKSRKSQPEDCGLCFQWTRGGGAIPQLFHLHPCSPSTSFPRRHRSGTSVGRAVPHSDIDRSTKQSQEAGASPIELQEDAGETYNEQLSAFSWSCRDLLRLQEVGKTCALLAGKAEPRKEDSAGPTKARRACQAIPLLLPLEGLGGGPWIWKPVATPELRAETWW